MYPDLSYLFHDLIGTTPDNWLSIFKTFGFFLALAFLGSAVTYYHELKRKSKAGVFVPITERVVEGAPASMMDLVSNAIAGFIFGGKGLYAFQHFSDFKLDPASVILSTKINWLGAIGGAALLTGMAWWEARRKQKPEPVVREVRLWPHDRIMEITTWAAIGGIVGAKFFDIFDNWSAFLEDPAGTLFSGGGLAFYGGLILGFVAVVWYQAKLKIPFLHAADAVAPALVVGYGVGRMGCQLSGDGDWGIVNTAPKPGWLSMFPDWFWAYTYPHNVLDHVNTDPVKSVPIEGYNFIYNMELSQPVFPTPVYEVLAMAFIFAVLWILRKRISIPGFIFFLYLGLIALERFLIEKIRVNVRHEGFLNLTQAELISVGLMLASLVGMVYCYLLSKKVAPTATVDGNN
jgi:phosphatidylglycerol---prolipoprotein diacylglyceryl transferase